VLPADAGANTGTTLYSTACASAGNCSAVGTYVDSLGHSQGVLLSQSANVWSAGKKAPLPSDAASDPRVSILSVSCASADNCTAVGSYQSSSGVQGLSLSESSGAWSAIHAPLPVDAAANPAVQLSWVSCTSSGVCTAVGSYQGSSGSEGLLLTESSGSWTAARATLPNDAGANPHVSLTALSCASAGDCVAIGSYADSLSHNQPLLESEASGSWTPIKPPLPADASTGGGHRLLSVSCPAAGNCAVTGYYYDSSLRTQGPLLGESSGTWTPIKASPPFDAATNPLVSVASVSCPSAGECTAAGNYTDASNHSQGLALGESSGTWSAAIKAALHADAGTNPGAGLDSVSCASPGNCSAVGVYYDSSGNVQGLLLSESAWTWSTAIKTALPDDAAPNPDVELNAVSCATAGSCSTVGDYVDNSKTSTPGLLVSAIPANPTVTLSAPTTGTVGSALGPSTVGAVPSAGASPTGTITFRVFGPQASAPSSRASGGTIVGSASVSSNGAYHPAAAFTPTSAGDYWWYASYDGDASDNPGATQCGAQMPATVVASTGAGSGGSSAGTGGSGAGSGGSGAGTGGSSAGSGGSGAGTGGSSAGSGGSGGGTGGPGGASGGGRLSVNRVKVVGSILRVSFSCTHAPCSVTLKLTGTEMLKGNQVMAESAATRRHKVVTLAAARVALTAGQSKTVKLALNATGTRLVAKFHQLKATRTISVSGKVLTRKTVTFRAT
jgi:hypothetical protein